MAEQGSNANEKVLESYTLDVKGTVVHVRIYTADDVYTPIYETTYPGMGAATQLLLLSLRPDLMLLVPLDPNRLSEAEYVAEMKDKYVQASEIGRASCRERV